MNIKGCLHNYIYEQHWSLGFIEQPVWEIVKGRPFEIRYVKGIPRDRWYADPFILDYDDSVIQVLAEEFCYSIRRGRIAKLIIERSSYKFLESRIILDLPTHLSFPFIIRRLNSIYIAPENSASGEWCLYEYHSCSDTLTKVKTISTEPLTDAIMTDFFGDTFIFATHLPAQNGNILSVYDEEGVHLQEIVFRDNYARNAGAWFMVDDTVYRPAQDCNDGYGKAVIIQEVTRDSFGRFAFNNKCRITSSHPMFTTGCHTFNSYDGLSVIDVHGYKRETLASFVSSVKELI